MKALGEDEQYTPALIHTFHFITLPLSYRGFSVTEQSKLMYVNSILVCMQFGKLFCFNIPTVLFETNRKLQNKLNYFQGSGLDIRPTFCRFSKEMSALDTSGMLSF